VGRDETNNKEVQLVTTLSLHQKTVLKGKKISSFRRSIQALRWLVRRQAHRSA
jgi:hypothetical protein